MSMTEMVIQMQRQISSQSGRRKHGRNTETGTDNFVFLEALNIHMEKLTENMIHWAESKLFI